MSNPQRLRFLFRPDDHQRVMTNSIVVQDDAAQPEILRIALQFDSSAPVPVMPLYEAELRYIPVLPGTINFPAVPDQVAAWTPPGYANLPVRGTLMITPRPKSARAILKNLDAIFKRPFVTPKAMWIWPVTLPMGFFADFFNVPAVRRHQSIKTGNRKIPTGANNWPQFAAAAFLRGATGALVEFHANDPLNDESITRRMPELVPDAAGNVEFRIAFSSWRENEHDPLDTLADLAAGRSLLDPTHPINALIHAHWTLRKMGDRPLGSAMGLPLPDHILGGSAPPAFDVIRFATPGANYSRIFHSAQLARASFTVTRRLIGTIVRQAPLPTNGWLVLPQENTPAGVSRANVNIDFGNSLRYTQTNANRPGFTAGINGFDFGDGTYDTIPAFAVVQPAAPARTTDAERRVFSQQLARPTFKRGRSPEIDEAVGSELDDVAAMIQPVGWPPAQKFYPGTRQPKSDVTENDIRTLFSALQRIDIGVPSAPTVRPGEAMTIWIIEGKIKAKKFWPRPPAVPSDAFVSGRRSAPFDASLLSRIPGALPIGSVANIRAATDTEVRSMIRSFYLWNFFGLDHFADTFRSAAIDDVVLNWGTSVANGAALQDQSFRNGLAGLTAAGFATPTLAQVNAAMSVTFSGGTFRGVIQPAFVELALWLQYSEFLRRIRELEAGPNAGAAAFPAFRYMVYNARPETLELLWTDANNRFMDPNRPPWVTSPELALRVQRIPAAAMNIAPNGVASIMSGNHRVRSIAIRFGIVYQNYGTVFPFVLEP